MLIATPGDIGIVLRARREHLKLRQAEVARAAGVGRQWLVDAEAGKPSVELGMVMHTLDVLGVEIAIYEAAVPDWARPLAAAAVDRARRAARNRRLRQPQPIRELE